MCGISYKSTQKLHTPNTLTNNNNNKDFSKIIVRLLSIRNKVPHANMNCTMVNLRHYVGHLGQAKYISSSQKPELTTQPDNFTTSLLFHHARSRMIRAEFAPRAFQVQSPAQTKALWTASHKSCYSCVRCWTQPARRNSQPNQPKSNAGKCWRLTSGESLNSDELFLVQEWNDFSVYHFCVVIT